MRIVFHPDFESGAWPGPLERGDASIGEVWAGPKGDDPFGLPAILERTLGLTGIHHSKNLRELRLVAELESVEGFWSRSAEVDPIGSARRILALRDELWMCGWRGQGKSRRLRQLAWVTKGVLPGLPDRLEDIALALKTRSAGIERLELLEEISELPAAWRDVVEGLKARGTAVEIRKLEPADAPGDLGASRKPGFIPSRDGSLQLLRPPGNLEAADEVAAWLSCLDDRSSAVVIWPDAVLDQALRRHGLPTTGSKPTSDRSSLVAVMPLVLALGWSPADPRHAAELLALPVGPVPHDIAGRLLDVLQEWPAVSSDLWNQVLEGCLADLDDKKYRSSVMERIQIVFDAVVPRGARYPVSEAERRLNQLDSWLHGRLDGGKGDAKAHQAAIKQCASMRRMVRAFPKDDLSRRDLLLLIDRANEVDDFPPPYPPEAGLIALGKPGGVAGRVRHIVWWNFSLTKYSPPQRIPLSSGEEKELMQIGIDLTDPGRAAIRDAVRWRRPLEQAEESVLLVCPQRAEDGKENFPHPAWDEVKSRLSSWHMEKDLVTTRIFGREMPRLRRRSLLPLPAPVTRINISKGLFKQKKSESPSSLGPLIGCPLQYVLKYSGEVATGRSTALPEADEGRMRGNLSHLLIGKVLEEKRKRNDLSSDQAREMAGRLFDQEVPRLMAVLFLPGNDAARAEIRRAVCEAAFNLVRVIDRMGLRVLEIEKKHKTEAFGTKVSGQLDLLTGDPEKVIDLKWSGGNYYIEALGSGSAYQLAVYSRLVRPKGQKAFPPVAYYVIRENRLLATDKKAFPEAEPIKGPDPSVTWAALDKAYAEVMKSLKNGEVASGALYEPLKKSGIDMGSIQDKKLVLPPLCRFCDFDSLCLVGEKWL